ncbi:cubilin, partial [Plakobranchus ocellatus]
CGGTFNAFAGRFNSPGYPDPYPGNTECVWQITTAPGNSLQLSFNVFSLDPIGGFYDDYVEIYTPDINGQLQGRWFANNMPSNLTNMAGIWIKFRSNDDENTGPGFSAEWTTGVILLDILPQGQCINAARYCSTLDRLKEAIRRKRPGPLRRGVVLQHDNATPHSANLTQQWLQRYGWEILPHPAHSPDLAPSDFHLFGPLKRHSGGMAFETEDDLIATSNELTGNIGQIGSPGALYPNNADLRWTILVDPGNRIRITFNSFDMQRNIMGYCYFDFLQIFDGAESDGVSLGRFCGDQLPDPVTSENNQVSLWLHTDYHLNFPGFLLSWQAIPTVPVTTFVPPTSSSGCGGVLFANETAEQLTSPGYPSDHAHYLDCYWTIAAPRGGKVSINFTDFELEYHHVCHFDFVEIRDGGLNGTLIGRYCSRNTPPRIVSETSVVSIYFRSDYSIAEKGFALMYQIACGGTQDTSSGVITSPGYPSTYPDGQNCTWRVTVPLDRTILVSFNQPFNILPGPSGDCSNDYLQLYNGIGLAAPPLVVNGSSNTNGRYCGSSPPTGRLETGSNFLTANFISDASSSAAGFSFNYTEQRYGCGGRLYLLNGVTSGYFTSPRYPNPYPQNVDCKWVIIAPATMRVQVDFVQPFYIEDHDNCKYDYISFRDGGTENAPSLGAKSCGTHLPGSVVSSGNVLFARFQTDDSVVRQGFRARYSIASCGGRITAMDTYITSPNFPNNYGPNLNCFWVIQGPVGHYLTLKISPIRLQYSNDCEADVLEVIDPSLAPSNDSLPEQSPAAQGISVIEAAANASGGMLFRDCGRRYSETTVETADNRAYIWFRSDGQNSGSGFKIEFTASVEVCGGTLTLPSGVITSPNYPNSYAHRRRCRWDITVAAGRKITLTFTDFRLESTYRCRGDFVYVKNGLLRRSPRLGRFCGTTPPSPVSSSGNTMRVYFITDRTITHGGFRAEYSSDLDADCGGVLTENTGIITSPNFTTSRGGNYDHSVQCLWQIHNDAQHSTIRMKFTHMDLEYHSNCYYDFVQIREGTSRQGGLVGTFCGNSSTNFRTRRGMWQGFDAISIPTPDAWVAFISDHSISGGGFRMEYRFTDCGGVYNGPSGVITSPNYPNNYNDNDDCAWLIRAPEGMVIKVNVTDFEFERHSNCHYDFMMIQNGGDYDAPKIGSYCHNDTVPPITSQSNELRIVMSTDSSITSRGFRLEYSFSERGCGGHLTSNDGTIQSPNYPSSYPDNSYCMWDIIVENNFFIVLTFTPPFDVACNDFVKVYDIHDNGTADLLGSYCHNTVPPVLKSSFNKMRVVFQSDATTNGNGFSANFSTECGAVIETDRATLVSPGYPGYRENLFCKFVLNPGSGKTLRLNFRDFQLERHSQCNYDYLRIYQGTNTSGIRIANLCGDIRPEQVVARNQMYLEFKTDGSRNNRGYRASYRAEACGGNFTSRDRYINTPAYPHPYPNNANCTWNITVEHNKVIVLKFRHFDVQSSYNCYADYVAIYDGNSRQATSLGRFCGDRNAVPRVIRSPSNSLLLNLISNYYGSGKGFTARYIASYGPSLGCGGNLQEASGAIQSLDIDNDGYHEKSLDCLWTITAEPNKVIVVNITNLHLEDGGYGTRRCPYDYVKVYDGTSQSDPLLLHVCGHQSQPVVAVSSSNTLVVHFVSDSVIVRSGFNMTYYQQDAVCGGNLNATSALQNLTSPGYLSSSDVPLRCRWTFDSGSHWEQIRFTVNDLQLGSDCQNEYLDIRDKPMGRHGMHHRACGSVIPPPFYSRNRQATVIYHKDTTSSLGFTLSYQKTNCHRTYTGSAGRITTPLFPANYAHHLTCTSHVIAPEGTFLSFYFEVFRLEGGWSGSCPYDYVQISNVNYDSGRLCGHNPPPPIFLSGNNATYRIESDGSVAYTGFAMTYVASTTGPGCGGNLSHAIPGMIASPEYPGAPAGPLECNWYLSSPSMLLLNFTFVGTPGSDSSSCDDSYVQVVRQDGSSYGRFCSLNDPRQIRLETATIKYVVTPSANATIFKLKFTYFDEGTF